MSANLLSYADIAFFFATYPGHDLACLKVVTMFQQIPEEKFCYHNIKSFKDKVAVVTR